MPGFEVDAKILRTNWRASLGAGVVSFVAHLFTTVLLVVLASAALPMLLLRDPPAELDR